METAEELSPENCERQLQWIRRDFNQLAGDLTNEGLTALALILDWLLVHSDSSRNKLGMRKRVTLLWLGSEPWLSPR